MASFTNSQVAKFQQEKDYLTNEVIKSAQNEKELLAVCPFVHCIALKTSYPLGKHSMATRICKITTRTPKFGLRNPEA